jgi:alkylated DNA repair dioxygenase AlkB
MTWQPIETAPEGVPVRTKIHDANGERADQPMTRKGRLWWFTDGSMYVYYTPTHWMPLPEPPS